MPAPPIYLDHNANSAMSPRALQAWQQAHRLLHSGVRTQPRLWSRLLHGARARVARSLGAQAHEVVFTSGGTEANSLFLASVAARARGNTVPARLCLSMLEHPSIAQGAAQLQSVGALALTHLPTDRLGRCVVDPLLFAPGAAPFDAVSLLLANNETGVVQPIEKMAQARRSSRAWLHTDAVQAVGRMPVHFGQLDVDFLTLAGHKVGAGASAGALVVRETLGWSPPAQAGAMRDADGAWRLPSGEQLPAIFALSAALDEVCCAPKTWAQTEALRGAFEAQLQQHCAPVIVLGQGAPRLPNTSCVRFVGCRAESLLVALDVRGLCVSLGSACSSGVSTPSATVRAMGLSDTAAAEVLRVSLPLHGAKEAIEADLAALLAALKELCVLLRRP